jgi:hypothetical protein
MNKIIQSNKTKISKNVHESKSMVGAPEQVEGLVEVRQCHGLSTHVIVQAPGVVGVDKAVTCVYV